MIPFLSLDTTYLELKDEIDSAVSRILNGGWYIGGTEVEEFEAEWANYCGVNYAIGTGNGLDALILAIRALGIGENDEVIVPSHTFIATWLAVTAVGARPVGVDSSLIDFNIDVSQVESAITPMTKAIIPVHLYGQPVDLDPIIDIAKKYRLAIIEDAAQAHGARYKGRRLGGHGDVVCWSFYPGKNLGAFGDAGCITTDRYDLAEKVRMLGNYGSAEKYVHRITGSNSRLDAIQAAILRVKLKRLDCWTERRQLVAKEYERVLNNLDIGLPKIRDNASHVWHLYAVRSQNRSQLMERLKDVGIGSQIHYPIPPHLQEAYSALGHKRGDFPVTEKIASEVFSLPIGPHTGLEVPGAVRDALKGVEP